MRQDGDSSLSRLPLPAKFGTVSDIYIEPELHYKKTKPILRGQLGHFRQYRNRRAEISERSTF